MHALNVTFVRLENKEGKSKLLPHLPRAHKGAYLDTFPNPFTQTMDSQFFSF